jgi:hypothetical protein
MRYDAVLLESTERSWTAMRRTRLHGRTPSPLMADTRTRYLPTLKPTPGAEKFVQWLIESGLKVVVATSALAGRGEGTAGDLRRGSVCQRCHHVGQCGAIQTRSGHRRCGFGEVRRDSRSGGHDRRHALRHRGGTARPGLRSRFDVAVGMTAGCKAR